MQAPPARGGVGAGGGSALHTPRVCWPVVAAVDRSGWTTTPPPLGGVGQALLGDGVVSWWGLFRSASARLTSPSLFCAGARRKLTKKNQTETTEPTRARLGAGEVRALLRAVVGPFDSSRVFLRRHRRDGARRGASVGWAHKGSRPEQWWATRGVNSLLGGGVVATTRRGHSGRWQW